ncbi:MAG: Succinate-semialdehyde dehydrogenase (acetylating) [Verrucomicrobia subdivision 3 bacterium]|nr:Succinate-semialdehyde dehydrogenase (acetylating) [Limisphaerales bacterium]MCS1414017.1 Succinate-semialdehyde dehydrogenase (acetylating) [Limisphaerales bacterium]
MSSALNESLIRDVVAEVLGRLEGQTGGAAGAGGSVAPSMDSCQWHARSSSGGTDGVFQTAAEACEAAYAAYLDLQKGGIEARRKVEEIIKTLCNDNAELWGRIELEETKIGRLDHKIEKLQIIKLVPGVDWLRPFGWSGDHGITMEEYTPFSVIGAVTPSTHSIPTLAGNVVNIVGAGNSVVFNAHPAASKCAAMAVGVFNQAIRRETGIRNLICIIEEPTFDSFKEMCSHEAVRLLCVTGGPGVVKAAMQTGKRAICAGPGNPPVLVDDTACMERAAEAVIQGATYDNNLLCIGEKEVFVLDKVADQFMSALEKAGAFRLWGSQLDQLTQAAFSFEAGEGAGCSGLVVNKDLIGRDASVLAEAAGVNLSVGKELLFAETDEDHPFVKEEQMMPFLPIVRVPSVEAGIEASRVAEHQYKHTSIIHSHDVNNMTAMARALDTTLFVKNGPCMAGLGLGGEGYLSYSIATPTGEGVTNTQTFTRVRRCVMVDNLRIY